MSTMSQAARKRWQDPVYRDKVNAARNAAVALRKKRREERRELVFRKLLDFTQNRET